MADKIEKNVLVGSLVMRQDGKPLEGEPVRGTVNVWPIRGSAISIVSGDAIVKALKALYPNCVFNFFAKPAEPVAALKK